MKSKIDKDILIELYINQMKTDDEIASIFRCTNMSIYRARKRFNICAYKRWERNICEPTNRQKEIIYASLLGDGSISINTRHRYINKKKIKIESQSCFEESHCEKQKEYLYWKYNELKNLCTSSPVRIKKKKVFQWRVRTFCHPFFTKLRQDCYPNNKKIVNIDHLSNIGPLGLAVWYMDDGTICKTHNKIRFCTCSFTENEHKILIEWIWQKFKIETYMRIYSGYRFLVVDIESRDNFIKTVKDYIIDCMKYKITYREYDRWINI